MLLDLDLALGRVPAVRKVDLHLVLHDIIFLDCDLELLESSVRKVDLHLVLHEIMVLQLSPHSTGAPFRLFISLSHSKPSTI